MKSVFKSAIHMCERDIISFSSYGSEMKEENTEIHLKKQQYMIGKFDKYQGVGTIEINILDFQQRLQ